ncbi:MAG: hypothetical protein NTX45_03855 [Proteobacteria bacterium]|nr:hypothetical protein [Pseudomonadota bacterium]
MPNICPVCKTELKEEPKENFERDVTFFSCPRCGDFAFSHELIEDIPGILQRNKNEDVKISHALLKMQRINNKVELLTTNIEAILKNPLPRPQEQADLLIRWFAEHSDAPGDLVSLDPIEHNLSIIGAKSKAGFVLILSHLIGKVGLVKGNLVQVYGGYAGLDELSLTFDGWEYYETLLKGKATYRKAFMAMQFGDYDLNEILEKVFKPSVKMAGFDLFKSDDKPRAGPIDDHLRVDIQSSDFLIADLTHDNLGAYWEAGYAEGLGKPVIYTCEKEKFHSKPTHFDTNHHLTVFWDKKSPEQAGDELKATIRATLPQLAKFED